MPVSNQQKEIEKGINAFVELMGSHTISLVMLSQERLPTAFRSGIIIRRENGTTVTMTAAHELGAQPWFIETITDNRANGSLLIDAGKLSQVMAVESWANDLVFYPFPAPEIDRSTLPAASVPIYQHHVSVPRKDEAYGFAVWRQGKNDLVRAVPHYQAIRELVCEIGMEYVGDEDGLYLFKLAGNHRGHDWYKGVSGGPIADPSGLIVAVVKGGDENRNIIFGQPLAPYAKQLGIPTR